MHRLALALAPLLCLPVLAGCGGSSSSPTTDQPLVIHVEITGDDVTPSGTRVKVAVGRPVELDVTADRPGEIHVHSSPEQELDYGKGRTTVRIDPIETPGVVAVESHALDKVIVQLQVS